MTDAVPTAEPEEPASPWLIIASEYGYMVAKEADAIGDGLLKCETKPEAPFPFIIVHPSYVIARHSTEAEADKYCLKSQEAERLYRPFWMAAVRHEQELRMLMIEAGRAAAQPASAVN